MTYVALVGNQVEVVRDDVRRAAVHVRLHVHREPREVVDAGLDEDRVAGGHPRERVRDLLRARHAVRDFGIARPCGGGVQHAVRDFGIARPCGGGMQRKSRACRGHRKESAKLAPPESDMFCLFRHFVGLWFVGKVMGRSP